MRASAFRQELLERKGVYCVLMDGSCIKGAAKSTGDQSLRGLILLQPVKLDAHPVEGVPTTVEVRVWNEANIHDTICSFFFKKGRGGWRLEDIEYD
jgi:hypothetical protein